MSSLVMLIVTKFDFGYPCSNIIPPLENVTVGERCGRCQTAVGSPVSGHA